VLYRAVGEDRWHEGITVNLSPSGALIAGDAPIPCADLIAVVIPLPSAGGCLTGRGRIVRVPALAAHHERGAFAIAVPHYLLERQSTALARLETLHQGC
jgi:hypothetical protein